MQRTTDNMNASAAGVTAEDVISSIEMILGRTPDQGLVDYHLQLGFPNRIALGQYMLSTREFEDRYANGTAVGGDPLGYWQARARGAELRRQRLKSFGPRARGILTSTENGLFVVDPEDGFIATSLLQHGSYSSAELEFDLSLLGPESKVLIVGTHIGSLAIPIAKQCAYLTALEANPHTFELLQANVRLSGAANISLYHAVAGEQDGEIIRFVVNRDNSGGSKIMPKMKAEVTDGYLYDSPDVIELPTQRIDSLLGEQDFDLIIMDIEGSEVFALRGMPNILSRAKTLAVEFRPHSLIEVAGVGIDEFHDAVVPYFEWLLVPGEQLIYRNNIASCLKKLFDDNICHDAIYFFKEKPANLGSGPSNVRVAI